MATFGKLTVWKVSVPVNCADSTVDPTWALLAL